MMFMILLYHSLAENHGSGTNSADEENKCESVKNVLLAHCVLQCGVDGFIIAQISLIVQAFREIL